MLGGIAPSIASAAATQPSKPEDNAANEAKAKDKFKPDPNEKVQSLQESVFVNIYSYFMY